MDSQASFSEPHDGKRRVPCADPAEKQVLNNYLAICRTLRLDQKEQQSLGRSSESGPSDEGGRIWLFSSLEEISLSNMRFTTTKKYKGRRGGCHRTIFSLPPPPQISTTLFAASYHCNGGKGGGGTIPTSLQMWIIHLLSCFLNWEFTCFMSFLSVQNVNLLFAVWQRTCSYWEPRFEGSALRRRRSYALMG